jgi:hypothetical protein
VTPAQEGLKRLRWCIDREARIVADERLALATGCALPRALGLRRDQRCVGERALLEHQARASSRRSLANMSEAV